MKYWKNLYPLFSHFECICGVTWTQHTFSPISFLSQDTLLLIWNSRKVSCPGLAKDILADLRDTLNTLKALTWWKFQARLDHWEMRQSHNYRKKILFHTESGVVLKSSQIAESSWRWALALILATFWRTALYFCTSISGLITVNCEATEYGCDGIGTWLLTLLKKSTLGSLKTSSSNCSWTTCVKAIFSIQIWRHPLDIPLVICLLALNLNLNLRKAFVTGLIASYRLQMNRLDERWKFQLHQRLVILFRFFARSINFSRPKRLGFYREPGRSTWYCKAPAFQPNLHRPQFGTLAPTMP